MTNTYLAIAREFADLIRARMQAVRKIILFGSVARGDATEASDIDVAIILDRKDQAAKEIRLEAAEQIMNRHDALIGCITYSNDEWEKAQRFTLGSHILKHGVNL